MSSIDAEALERGIRTFVREHLRVAEEPGLTSSEALISSGLIDSAGLVRLVAELERLSGVRIPDDDVSLDHFDCIQDAVCYVMNRL